jgi:DNA-binding GntR family transcriptional regulator
MGISRTPVREAIRQLEQAGLVTVYPNRETVVTSFTANDVREIYQLRAAVEGMAARIAAERRKPVAVAAIVDVLTRMEAVLAQDDEPTYFELDIAFHDEVLRASANSRLLEVRLRVRDQTRRYLTRTLGRVSRSGLQRNFYEHEAIGVAIRDGDADRAESLMRRHISSNGDRIAQHLLDASGPPSLDQRAVPTARKEDIPERDRATTASVASTPRRVARNRTSIGGDTRT